MKKSSMMILIKYLEDWMAKNIRNKDNSNTTEQESFISTTTTTEPLESTVYCVISEETGGIQYLHFSEARSIIEKQQQQIFAFSSRLRELDSNSELIKNYFSKSTEVNKQLLDRYRKLLDWIFKGGISILLMSLLLVALPLILIFYKFNGTSLDTIKSFLWWIVGLYGLINIGGLFTWGLATFGFKKQLDNLEKRIDRIEDLVFKK